MWLTLRGRDSHEACVCDESWLAVVGNRVGGSVELDDSTSPSQCDKCMYIHACGKEDFATPYVCLVAKAKLVYPWSEPSTKLQRETKLPGEHVTCNRSLGTANSSVCDTSTRQGSCK